MRSSHIEPFGSQRSERDHRGQWSQQDLPMTSASSTVRRMQSEDSWIEISSRPSSSSLSSTSNDIITTGLQVQSQDERRPRQSRSSTRRSPAEPRSASATGSSQDEYEESESESDQVLSSSNEDVYQVADGVEDDDSSTALGIGSADRVFTPQPNAFSHPPSALRQPHSDPSFPPAAASAPASARFPSEHTATQRAHQRPSLARNRTATSSFQADHDAALRASLTTLLSCAAAVRPKGQERPINTRQSAPPTTLRLVPESELEQEPRPRGSAAVKQAKRKSRETSKERHVKKLRGARTTSIGEELISPTLATWMISAGVVLFFSAISFSAGYAWGREAGRIEGEMAIGSGGCGRETMRGAGLRRLRWSTASSSIRV